MQELIYQGSVYWAHANEIEVMGVTEKYIGRQFFSFSPPLSKHRGTISLFSRSILLEGDIEVIIPLADINQLYIGFDEVFSPASVKNFGLFWKPLRINYGLDESIYLIVDYNMMTCNNGNFYALLKDMLS